MQSQDSGRNVAVDRQHGLDLVRATAIAWVMLYHAHTMQLAPASAPWLINFGWMGVDLFFVLSGFLIAGQLLKPWASGARPDYRRFFERRLLRTVPAFAIILILYFACPQIRETADIQPFWQFATFTENLLVRPIGPKAFDQVWSLCVEEQFYLFFPLVLYLIAFRPSLKKSVIIGLAVLIAGIFTRSFLWLGQVAERPFELNAPSDWHAYVALIYYPTWSRLDGLLAGVTLAAVRIFRPSIWKRFVAQPNLLLAAGCTGIGLAIILFGLGSQFYGAAIGFPILSASVALVVAAASTGSAMVGRYPIVGGQALATGAYSLYLSHKIAFHLVKAWVGPATGASGYPLLTLALAFALVTGAVLYWAVERPFLLLRDRLDRATRIRSNAGPAASHRSQMRHARRPGDVLVN